LEDIGGGGGGGGGTCILVEFLSTFSTEEEGTGASDGDDGRDSFVASGCVIGFVPFTGVETSILSSTSGTANIFFFDSRYFIRIDMILFTRLILFASSSFSPFSRSLLFLT
jgi:hypothetical protein